mmetsp:Transcript_57256/g.105815  ORF Transcript_57256/g.105815 Transcript_57256/m.105815 type:complete len:276 (-) Transcript_57256:1007-1834(-)
MVALEDDAFLLHEINAPQHFVSLVELHGWNSIHQQASWPVCALYHLDEMASSVQLLCRSQTCGASTDHCDAATCALQRRLRLDPALGECILDDCKLSRFDGHGLLVDTKHACLLAGCRASSAGELRKVVRIEQSFQSSLPLALMHELIPCRYPISKWASSTALVWAVACRSSAIHTSGSLCLHPVVPLLRLLSLRGVHLLPIQDTILVVTVWQCLALVVVEALSLDRVLHGNWLLSSTILEVESGRQCRSQVLRRLLLLLLLRGLAVLGLLFLHG